LPFQQIKRYALGGSFHVGRICSKPVAIVSTLQTLSFGFGGNFPGLTFTLRGFASLLGFALGAFTRLFFPLLLLCPLLGRNRFLLLTPVGDHVLGHELKLITGSWMEAGTIIKLVLTTAVLPIPDLCSACRRVKKAELLGIVDTQGHSPHLCLPKTQSI
jgi:hypothetical protein